MPCTDRQVLSGLSELAGMSDCDRLTLRQKDMDAIATWKRRRCDVRVFDVTGFHHSDARP